MALGSILGYTEVRRSSRATASRVHCVFSGSASQAHQVESLWLGQAPQLQVGYHSSLRIRTTGELAVCWMEAVARRCAPRKRLFDASTDEQLPRLQAQRAEVCNGLRGADAYHLYSYLPRIENIWTFHGALLHAPQWAQLHAISCICVGLHQI